MRPILFVVAPLFITGGCAPSLLEREGVVLPTGDSDQSLDTADTSPPPVRVVTSADGDAYQTWIDATEYLEFVYFSFATGEAVEVADPLTSVDWDLGFERYLIASDGGVSGPGGVTAVALPDTDFDSLSQAPADGYVSDLPDDDDENQNPEYALGDWFDYAEEDHTVTPTPSLVYVVKAVSGTYYKWQFVSYYDDAGSPAYITARWAAVAAP